MFYQLLAEILASLIKGPPTTKQNVYPAVHCVYSRVKSARATAEKVNKDLPVHVTFSLDWQSIIALWTFNFALRLVMFIYKAVN
jgi:hypothetical protein